MIKMHFMFKFLACNIILMFGAITIAAASSGEYLSPLALVSDQAGQHLYVAEATAKQLAFFGMASGKLEKVASLPLNPTGIAISPDGKTLYSTGDSPEGKVFAVSTDTGKILFEIPVGHTPVSPVATPDGKTLFVANRFNNNIAVIDLETKKLASTIPVKREPVAMVLTPDARLLFVANHLPYGAMESGYASAEISVIDTASRQLAGSIRLPNGSTGLRGICASPDGKYVYVTHILARYQMPTTQLERGWTNTNAVSVIDVSAKKYVNTILLDNLDLGAANPWGVACSGDGAWLCVTHAGTNELSIIDRKSMHDKLDRLEKGEKVSGTSLTPGDVSYDLSFLVGIRRRIPLSGIGPRGIAMAGQSAWVAEYFSDSITSVDMRPDAVAPAKSFLLGPAITPDPARKGEMLFNDATICFQKWQSCASCHPDGRADALNWDLLNDGIGNPKQTKSLLLAHKTPPMMALGVRKNAETAVRSGMKFILFSVHSEIENESIDEYLKTMQPVPSPYLVKGQLSEAAERGKKIFEKAGCARCHPGPLYTDLKSYDIGLGVDLDAGKPFDTPTLVEIWRTAPYLYDGRASTMHEAFTKWNKGDKHGITSNLSESELNDLVEFILSL